MPTTTSLNISHRHATPQPGRTDLRRAWTATGAMVVGIVGLALTMTWLDLDLSYGGSAVIRGVGVVVVVLLATAAVRSGTRASRQGHASGMAAAVLAGTIASLVTLLAILGTLAHLPDSSSASDRHPHHDDERILAIPRRVYLPFSGPTRHVLVMVAEVARG